MSFDTKDSYDAAAWWQMQLCCEQCGTMLDYDETSPHEEGSDAYWHDYGQRAKKEGWRVVSKSSTATVWSVSCGKCAKEENSFRFEVRQK